MILLKSARTALSTCAVLALTSVPLAAQNSFGELDGGPSGPPPLTTGTGGPPPLTTGSGGPPPLTTGTGGPPPLTTGSGGPPPLTTGTGGPPPLTTGGPPAAPTNAPNGTPQQPPGLSPQVMQAMQQIEARERQDFGIPATPQLHGGAMHGPTPTSIPGGRLITTQELLPMIQAQQILVFDVLGGPQTLPGAIMALPASQPGTFQDEPQQQLAQYLQQVTQGNTATPMVFYCQSVECWMSYNAALRAINAGYTNVYWYRGGIESWNAFAQIATQMGQPGQGPGAGAPQMPGTGGPPVLPQQ